MAGLLEHTSAPDFTLVDHQGRTIRLTDYRGTKIIILVFNRSLG